MTGRKNLKDEYPEIENVLKKGNVMERISGGGEEFRGERQRKLNYERRSLKEAGKKV